MSFYSKKTAISFVALAALGCVPLACSGTARDDSNSNSRGSSDPDQAALNAIDKQPSKALCDHSNLKAGQVACFARVRTDTAGKIKKFATPSGLGPSDIQGAYKIPSGGGEGKTIAIVDAMDDPNAEADLATYRSTFGLPPCTTANGCFKKVNQDGQASPLPAGDTGWAGEIALDLDMASAVCPECNILLVESNAASIDDLGTAVNAAVTLGATVVSNSYGGGEDGSEATYDSKYYVHAGVGIFASTGDDGYAASYPATSAGVISVGGTSLAASSSDRGWAEQVWDGAGSGCSTSVDKPAYQTTDACSKKATADVSAVADPNTGVAVYDTYGGSGWNVYGGTSVSSPLVASLFAKTGQGAATGEYAWTHTSNFYDVTSGSNGSCSPSVLCNAGAGWDGPTGVGTPNATAIAGGGGTDGGTPPVDSGPPADGGGGGGTCSHPICTSGGKLTSACDPCATQVCAADSYCCDTAWDSVCVGEVASVCGQTCN